MSSALLKIDEKGVGVGFRACVECSVVFSMCVCFRFEFFVPRPFATMVRPFCDHSPGIEHDFGAAGRVDRFVQHSSVVIISSHFSDIAFSLSTDEFLLVEFSHTTLL